MTSQQPELNYRTVISDSGDPGYVNRLLVGTAVTGLVRIEWVQARIGQIVPVNWSWVQMYEYLNGYMPYRYQVDDAQNMIVQTAVEKDFQWLLLYEHDNVPNPDALIRLNEYMTKASAPVVSGLYFTRSEPSEPVVFRGRGLGAYHDWKVGDKVYVDGVPTGFLLIHMGLLKSMWQDSEEYDLKGTRVRRVFNTPRKLWFDPESGFWNTTAGTSDLEWSTRVIEGDYLRKSGWGDYVDKLPDPRYPFIVDTNLFCWHIDPDGRRYPAVWPPPTPHQDPPPAPTLGVSVEEHIRSGEIVG